MNNHRKSLVLSALFLCISFFAFGEKSIRSNKRTSGKGGPSAELSANCSPPTGAIELDINNTRALIQNGGDLWWDFNVSQYEIPKGSGRTSLFAGSLWLGGQDVSGQLKVAAMQYRPNGTDFWTGPLSTQDAEVSAETCREYDRIWESNRDDVAEFVAWFNADDETRQQLYPSYSIPAWMYEWPANGRPEAPYYESDFLAPFVDVDGNTFYSPDDGDYPAYDLQGEADCREKITNIYGDQNLWWIFNDKGNIHTNTGSQAIGMEIRAQAFAFATNDEVNNMTFYNYELINRSTFTLTETYFGVWADADLGNPQDDYVGCDVGRGLGYCYNGLESDADNGGRLGYGENPPAVGIDFFQGPFQDADGEDNLVGIGEDEALNGVGYGDGKIDNERFGMRRFIYHNNTSPNGATTDPSNGTDYYNYLRGIWKDGSKMVYEVDGDGYAPEDQSLLPADFMFPGDSDPLGWGTDGNPQPAWTEKTAGNTPADRRFTQSAGPFTLEPGQVNNITIGVVWARATEGGPTASLDALLRADDKTQALFDACFKLIDGPDAPDIAVQELDQQVLFYLSNGPASNNFREEYAELDPFEPVPDSVDTDGDGFQDTRLTIEEQDEFRTFRFEGYQLYQLADETVGPDELELADRARLVAQVDVKNGIGQLVNYDFNSEIGASVPTEKVNGADEGILHSFSITEDQFALGDKALINHKTYYFMAIAYAQNRHGGDFGNLALLPDLYNEEDASTINAQKKPYLGGRKAASGPIRVIKVIPHKVAPENNGTFIRSSYGEEMELTRIEGVGNGERVLKIKSEDVDRMFEKEENAIKYITYEKGFSPVQIKVIDPLNVKPGEFFVRLRAPQKAGKLNQASWELTGDGLDAPILSEQAIDVRGEQLIPELGLSVSIVQAEAAASGLDVLSGLLFSEVEYENEQDQWLSGVADEEGNTLLNWIRAGNSFQEDDDDTPFDEGRFNDYSRDTTIQVTDTTIRIERLIYDPEGSFENTFNRSWAPLALTTNDDHGPMPSDFYANKTFLNLNNLNSVNIVFTPDESKWTRCAVLEMHDLDSDLAENEGVRGFMREARSVDKNGNPGPDGNTEPSNNPNDPNYISAFGMGWFPGYAIDVETGERLNMAFGEDSWLESDNGNDMKWNPTSRITEGIFQDIRFGGKHYVYVFRHDREQRVFPNAEDRMPAYDAGAFTARMLQDPELPKGLGGYPRNQYRSVFGAVTWVGMPVLAPNHRLLSNEATLRLRVNHRFDQYGPKEALTLDEDLALGEEYFVQYGPVVHDGNTIQQDSVFTATQISFTSTDPLAQVVPVVNSADPMYRFATHKLAPTAESKIVAEDALDEIRVVPNPYYAYSQYETDRNDNRVRIINLPDRCTITIYTVNGSLVRVLEKNDQSITSIDWNLKNHAQVPVASGMYIMHVEAPGIGEKVLKWFGAMRPVDFDSF